MTLVSSDRWGTLCFFGIVCGHFFCPVACLGSLFGGDIRIKARWDLVRVPSKLERLESVDSGQLVEVLTRVSLLIQWLTLVFRVGFSYFQGRFLLTDLFYPWELRHAWHESRRCVCCWARHACSLAGHSTIVPYVPGERSATRVLVVCSACQALGRSTGWSIFFWCNCPSFLV